MKFSITRDLTNEVYSVKFTFDSIGKNNNPVFSSTDEHFVDALGLAYLAFVLEFSELVNTIKTIERNTIVNILSQKKLKSNQGISSMFESLKTPFADGIVKYDDDDDLPGDKPMFELHKGTGSPLSYSSYSQWGTRNIYKSRNIGRTMW